MSKRVELSDPSIRTLIRELLNDFRAVVLTNRAQIDMARLRETKKGVCFAAVDYIDNGGPIDVTITDTAKQHIGEKMYELFPNVEGMCYYLKIKIDKSGLVLIVVSFHEHN